MSRWRAFSYVELVALAGGIALLGEPEGTRRDLFDEIVDELNRRGPGMKPARCGNKFGMYIGIGAAVLLLIVLFALCGDGRLG